MRALSLLTLATLCASCHSLPAAVAERPMRVETHGSLRRIMHEGGVGPAVALHDVLPGPHTYAVGALSELRGEVTIVDDAVFLAYPSGDAAVVERGNARRERAALLVVARVPRWSEWRVESEVPFEELDAFIERVATENGYDSDRRCR